MKKRLFLSLLALALTTLVFAQEATTTDDTTTITITGRAATLSTELPDVVVTCPPSAIPRIVLENSELALGFDRLEEFLLVPTAEVADTEEGVRVLEITAIVLDCESTPEEVTVIDRSPAVAFDEPVPVPENIAGLAESLSGYAIVNTGAANLRSCDEPTCTRVAVVNGGQSLVVLGRNFDESWWYVQVGDIRGWIWDDLVVLRGDLTDVPFVRTEGEPTPPIVYVGYTGNLVYDNLTSSGQAICAIQGDSFYPLVGRNSNTSWLLIEATCVDGTAVTGWLDADAALIRNTGRVNVPILSGDDNIPPVSSD